MTAATLPGQVDKIDLFAGAGGWDEALRLLDPDGPASLGIEWDAAACATAEAAGHHRIGETVDGKRLGADIALLDPYAVARAHVLAPDGVAGLLGSPPCQGFSIAGKGAGRGDTPLVLDALDLIATGFPADAVIGGLYGRCADPRTALVLEPLRWALDLTPEWIAWEQVAAVLPLWQACSPILRAAGYHVWTGVLRSEQYGVPQTRKRAVLIASRTREVGMPVPTHSAYHSTDPARLDPSVLPWVSMGEALGAIGPWAMRSNYGTGGDSLARGIRSLDQPAPTVTSKIDRNLWVQSHERGAGMLERYGARPGRSAAAPSFGITAGSAGSGTRLLWAPSGAAPGGAKLRVTVDQAATLQSFPADYPWRGNKGERYLQVGNAIPPLLAAHVVAEAAGLAFPAVAVEGAA